MATYDVDKIPFYILELFKQSYITQSDERLLELFFKKDVTQDDLDEFLSKWDIEEEGSERALVLSHFMKLHPELKYPQYVEPRLNGILKYFKFKNLVLLSHFKKICTAIKKENIDIMILKGGALKHCNPEWPRPMCDIDILIPEKDYQKALNIAYDLGYKSTPYEHSVDLFEPNLDIDLLDVHHKLDIEAKNGDTLYKDFFNRASCETVFNVEGIYVPCPEDMMFILLTNLTKNMARNTRVMIILQSIIDSMFLINMKPDFDWEIFWKTGVYTETELQLSIAIRFINEYAPVKLPTFFDKDFYYKSILFLYDDVIEE